MKQSFTRTSVKTNLLLSVVFLIVFAVSTPAEAQNYWDKVPVFPAQCYGEKDDFSKNVEVLRDEVKEKLEQNKRAMEEKANKMTNEERMAIATKYQNMKPEEIVKMQNEMMEINQAQTTFQQVSAEYEASYNQLESDFREEFGKRLGPIEAEYRKLPDGEGTTPWAIKKGEELMASYNKEYEAICAKYFTSTDAKFKTWMKDFKKYLLEQEVPYYKKMFNAEAGRMGFTLDDSDAQLMAIDRYLEKCATIFGLRRPYPQG